MKTLIGKVVSNKMSKTLVVEVQRQRLHPLYKKIMRRSRRYKVHSENPDIKVGELVKITQTKPISKEKHYKIIT